VYGLKLLLSIIFSVSLFSCAHYSPHHVNAIDSHRRATLQQITKAFIRIQVVKTYRIYACLETDVTQCQQIVEMSKATGFGSGGVIEHSDESSSILTATHVVDEFGQVPSVESHNIIGFLREFSRAYGMSQEELVYRLKMKHLRIAGVSTSVVAVAPDNSYEVSDTNCSSRNDVCVLTTRGRIPNIVPLSISPTPPQIGDRAYIASGPFGYAIPGMMVPLFEGVYSGSTPDDREYYTLQVTPGSSGSLIVNLQGEVVGIVSMFITGSFCPGELGCQVLPSGIAVSVPHSVITRFLSE